MKWQWRNSAGERGRAGWFDEWLLGGDAVVNRTQADYNLQSTTDIIKNLLHIQTITHARFFLVKLDCLPYNLLRSAVIYLNL